MAERSEVANETSDRYLHNNRGNVEIHICEDLRSQMVEQGDANVLKQLSKLYYLAV